MSVISDNFIFYILIVRYKSVTIRDNYPKYVLFLDGFDMILNGIKHRNIRDFLLAEEWTNYHTPTIVSVFWIVELLEAFEKS